MPLVIAPTKTATTLPIEVEAVLPENVRELSLDGVRRLMIQQGNQSLPLGELFEVSGSAGDDSQIVWQGDCSHVKRIGEGMTIGQVRVEGDCGMHLGSKMVGGEIEVLGNAADWVGAEMRGGRIRIRGNAENLVGAVYRGGRRGMNGGEIFIDGNAGDEIGHTMRRGLIAIRGACGAAAGFNMLAGSILLFGGSGRHAGVGMKRGTIGLFSSTAPTLLPTFQFACTYRPVFVRLLLKYLETSGFSVPAECHGAAYHRYCGDLVELGKGEILVKTAGA